MTIVATTRVVVAVRGADARSFLDAVVSQAVTTLAPGHWRSALWLDIHGATEAVFDIVAPPDGEHLLLVVPEGLADRVVDGLGGRTFLADAAFERTGHGVVAVRDGPSATVAQLGLDEVAPGTVVEADGFVVVGRRDGADLLVVADRVDEVVARELDAGALRLDASGWRDRCVRVGEPTWGDEIVPPHLPEELGLLATHVHLDKGCYPGQEAVARMWMLGRPRRRLARVEVSGDVAAGAEAGSGRGRTIVTGAAGDRGLAMVPGDTTVGARIEGEGWSVTVVGFVGDDAPVQGANPAVVRRRDRR